MQRKTPLRILIIDDDENDFFLFRRALAGCDAIWASNGVIGLEMLRIDQQFHAVIVDEHLGPSTMQGHEVIAKIQANWPHLKTILASGFNLTAEQVKALTDIGPVMILSKPLEAAHLQNLLIWIQHSS